MTLRWQREAPMPNGRCRMHGGLSTGPRTPEGIERIRQSRTKHGIYSQKFKMQRAKGCEEILDEQIAQKLA
jgi:hypothetical protein